MTNMIIERIQRIDTLIQMNRTGNAATLAQVIGVSERTIQRIIKQMKILGAPIGYNYLKRTYYYKEEGCFTYEISFSAKMKRRNSELILKSMKEYLDIINNNILISYN